MNNNNPPPASEILSPKELRRYAQQINLPEIGLKGQEKIKQAKVLIIGAGGKGTCVLQNLAVAGIGQLGICDNFPVQENDLCRQYLYGNNDLGKQKAIIAKQKLLEINSLVSYELHNVCLSEQNIEIICKEYDILIDTTDNYPARCLINDAAINLGKPVIFGSIQNSIGLVSIFNFKGGPSFKCLYPSFLINEKTLPDDFAGQISLISIIGAIIGNETIKMIIGHGSKLNGNLLIFDYSNYSVSYEVIKKNPENFK
jgi:sulfur-carrier protein adenylyltransferase/sulfurtransferase